jgi:hypothetical protein
MAFSSSSLRNLLANGMPMPSANPFSSVAYQYPLSNWLKVIEFDNFGFCFNYSSPTFCRLQLAVRHYFRLIELRRFLRRNRLQVERSVALDKENAVRCRIATCRVPVVSTGLHQVRAGTEPELRFPLLALNVRACLKRLKVISRWILNRAS